jgi:hypothetical protein
VVIRSSASEPLDNATLRPTGSPALPAVAALPQTTPVVMSSLPLAPAAPRCSAVGAGVEVFVPTSWVF